MIRVAMALAAILGTALPLTAQVASTRLAPRPVSRPASAPTGVAASRPVELQPAASPVPQPVARAGGYRGQWFSPVQAAPLMGRRLSGGTAFYPSAHTPVAQYAAAAGKTFFIYAGAPDGAIANALPPRMLIGYYDHRAGTVPKPVILLDQLPAGTYGAPALCIDATGRLWVFVSPLGTDQSGVLLRSTRPYEIDAWERVCQTEFTNAQPWYVPGRGLLVVHGLRAEEPTRVYFSISPDGLAWSKPQLLAGFGEGHAFISGRHQNKVGVALTYQPAGMPKDEQTNLYYCETSDFGGSWQGYPRSSIALPLNSANNQALVCDFGSQWRYFLRDLAFDPRGNPLMLYIMRHLRNSSPAPDTRIWYTSRWAIREWETTGTVRTDSDFDGGCILGEKNIWHMVLPSIAEPQISTSGGSLVRWKTEDQGRSWYPQQLSFDPAVNHNWVRRVVEAAPELWFLWSDGNSRRPGESRIWLGDRAGNALVLPTAMTADFQKPELVWKAPEPQTQPASQPAPASTSAPSR